MTASSPTNIRTTSAIRATWKWFCAKWPKTSSLPSSSATASATKKPCVKWRRIIRTLPLFLGQAAARLNLSESAVKAALQVLFNRTGVRTRSQLVRVALEQLGGGL